jgi:hypothetical protein
MSHDTGIANAKYFVPIFGSYYHFLCESALDLYNPAFPF